MVFDGRVENAARLQFSSRAIERHADFRHHQRVRQPGGGGPKIFQHLIDGRQIAQVHQGHVQIIISPQRASCYTECIGAWLSLVERLVRDQEAGGSNPLAPTIFFNYLQAVGAKTAHPVAHPHRVAWWIEGAYTALMAENATTPSGSGQPLQTSTHPLGQPLDFDVRGLRRRLPALCGCVPEGVAEKDRDAARARYGSAFSISGPQTRDNADVCAKEGRKTLGPASMPKHKAQQKLAEYIEEYTGRVTRQGSSINTFTDLWKAFSAVKSGRWSQKTREEDRRYLFGKHVLPIIGNQSPRDVSLTSLQLLLNKMAEDGYGKSAVGQIRTYIKACFEYATDEDLIEKNPARKLVMPNIRKKSCERFLSVDELRSLLSQACPREHLVLRILAVCGLRPAEVLVLRIEDFEGNSGSTRL